MSLDIEQHDQLLAWLREAGHVSAKERIECETLRGGVSNRTVLVRRLDHDNNDWVLKQALEKLRVEADWHSDPARILREAHGMMWLQQIANPGTTTPLLFKDKKHYLLAMQAVPQPHENFKTRLLRGDVGKDDIQQFGTLIGVIHSVSSQSDLQREALGMAFGDRTYFESLRLEPYYGYAAEQVSVARPFLQQLIDDTRQTQLTVVHGDYSPKNILIHNRKLILLDHEVIHFGDPAFDIGFSLTHLLSKAHHLASNRDAFAVAAKQYWSAYCDTLGDVPWRDELEPRVVRHTLGCLLARVAGRSPLEYLSTDERNTQRDAILALLPSPPLGINELTDAFLEQIERHAND